MGLRDKLANEQSALELKKAEEEEKRRAEEEEQKFGSIREQIQGLQSRQQQLESLRVAFEEAYTTANSDLETFKKAKELLVQLSDDFKDVLESKGVTTRQDLLENPEYSDEDEVVSYKEASRSLKDKGDGSVAGLRKVRKQLRDQIPDIDFNPKASQADQEMQVVKLKSKFELVIDQIDAELVRVEQSRVELLDQTPEGEVAKIDAAKAAIKERRPSSSSVRNVRSLDNSQQLGFRDPRSEEVEKYLGVVKKEDLQDAEEYGEDFVKHEIYEYSSDQVRADIARERRKKGLDIIEEDLQTLDKLPQEYDEALGAINQGKRAREQTLRKFEEFLGAPDNAEWLSRTIRYGNYGGTTPQVAEKFYDFIADMSFGMRRNGRGDPLLGMEEDLRGYQEKVNRVRDSKSFGSQYKVHAPDFVERYSDRRSIDFFEAIESEEKESTRIDLPNPQYFSERAKMYEEFCQRFQEALDHNPDAIYSGDSNRRHDVLGDYSSNRNTGNLSIRRHSVKKINFGGAGYLKQKLEGEEQKLKAREDSLLELLKDRLDIEWSDAEVSQMENQDQGMVRRFQSIEKNKERSHDIRQAKIDLASFRVRYGDDIESLDIRTVDSWEGPRVIVRSKGRIKAYENERAGSERIKVLQEELNTISNTKPSFFGKAKHAEELQTKKRELDEAKSRQSTIEWQLGESSTAEASLQDALGKVLGSLKGVRWTPENYNGNAEGGFAVIEKALDELIDPDIPEGEQEAFKKFDAAYNQKRYSLESYKNKLRQKA